MDPTTPVERFRLCRCIGGYRISPEDPHGAYPLLLALCGEDPHEVSRLRQGELPLVVGELMVQANQRGLLLEPKGRLADPVLHLSRASRRASTAEVPNPFASLPGRYAAHWGFSDMYPEHMRALEGAVLSGTPFDTGVFGVKKEIEYARVWREAVAAPLQLWVRCEADDGVALADTAFWAAAGGNDRCSSGAEALKQRGIPAEDVERLLQDLADEAQVRETNDAVREAQLPPSATLEQVTEQLDQLASDANLELEQRYERMVSLARERLTSL